ncbi:unnamed protein product [Discula destructiva]
MVATFRTWPWQLAPLAHRPAFAPALLHHATPAGVLAQAQARAQAHTQQVRHAASKSRRLHPNFRASMKRTAREQQYQEATSTLGKDMAQEQNTVRTAAETAVLAPRTLVPLPISKTSALPWSKWLQYYKEVALQRILDRAGIAQQTWRLKPKLWSRATFRAPRKGVVDTALALHADMSRCLAVGGVDEKARLAEICVPKLHRSLVAAIEARPRGRSYTWERVALKRGLWWPRLVDHKWTDIDVGYSQSFRQAVVGIESKQRLTELDGEGKVVGTKEMDVLEYVVLWKMVDKASLTQGNWLIYGTLKETSLETVLKEKEMMQSLSDIMAAEKVKETKRKLADK